jgi:RNA polymerase sigma-70 factor (ECF subfamily)
LKVIQLHSEKRKAEKQLEEVLAKLSAGDSATQAYVFAKYSPKMLGACRQYIRDMQYAEEIMLAGFLKVFTKIDSFTAKGNFEGWIRRIMINECISFLRKKNRMHFVEDDAFFESIEEDEIDNTEKISDLQRLVDGLREDYRVVFNLYVVEDYKHKEIAKMLGISENATKIRYKRAKDQVQAQYENLLKNKGIS